VTYRLAPVLIAALVLGGAPALVRAQDASEKTSQDADKLVQELGNDDYQKRDDAQRKLEALGRKALPALRKAEKESKDAEIRARAHEAIANIEKASPDDRPPPRRDREQKGEVEPGEPRIQPLPEPPSLDPNDFFKDFDKGMPETVQKMLERVRKQFEEMDREFEREKSRGPNGPNVRVFQFGTRSRTPLEQKLGATLDPPPPALRAQLDLSPTDAGLLVNELSPGSRAWKAGIKPYDVITALDGKAVRTVNDLSDLGSKEAKLEVIRKAKKETLLVHGPSDAPPADKGQDEGDKPEKKDPVRKF